MVLGQAYLKKLKTTLLYKITTINWIFIVLNIIFFVLVYNSTFAIITLLVLTSVINFFKKTYVEYILIIIFFIAFILASSFNTTKFTGKETHISGYITSIPKVNDTTLNFELKATNGEKIIVYIPKENIPQYINFQAGQVLKLSGKLNAPNEARVPNVFNYKEYLERNKIHWIFYVDNYTIYAKKKFTPTFLTYKISNYFKNNFTPTSSSYLHAMLLGNKDFLSEESYSSVSNIGIMHLFTVSGLHINLIIIYLLLLMKPLKKRKFIQYTIIHIFLFLYMVILNFSPSIMRATLFYILSLIFYKHRFSKMQLLSLTFCLVFLFNPLLIYSIGFILTFLVTSALLIVIPQFKNKLAKIIFASLIASIASFPILSYYFFSININSFFGNIIYGFFVSSLFLPASLLVAIMPFLEHIYLWIVSFFENILIIGEKITSPLFIVGKPSFFLILFYYLILLLSILFLRYKRYFISFLSLLFIVAILFTFKYANTNIEITMIDVGQGDSFLIRDRHNSCNMLIDTGGSTNNTVADYTLLPYFKSLGISSLDFLVITHADFDHFGEAEFLLNNINVNAIILNAFENSEKIDNLLSIASHYNISVYSLEAGDNFTCGNLSFDILSPAKNYNDTNDNSLVLYTQINSDGWLFTGDISKEVELKIMNAYPHLKIDVLKLSHHGSNTSTSAEFISHFKPKYALISCALDNRYGHPTDEVLAILTKYNITIYRTDIMKTVRYRQGYFSYKWIFM